ncbi:DUF1236 domain-containing protein [Thioclava sp. GXIMD4216]|uniref:DUF1236 domain-containing protein n=1 Tax=Thioclava litoralis TaxID=3076557 RepID=A0ABZ1DYG4_9RHOB|nr:DUF1236 domain-containing protein [Thioclava sp. FTW29]
MFKKTTMTVAAFATLATAGLATSASAFPAMLGTDSSLRAGPGADYQVSSTVPQAANIEVDGCISTGSWCQVSYGDNTGWTPASNIAIHEGNNIVYLADRPKNVDVKTIEIKDNGNGQAAGAFAGAAAGGAAGGAIAAGTVIGGPAGAVVGALIGGALVGEAAKPEPTTVTYVQEHPVDPVFLKGDVKTGAKLPDNVALQPVPDSKYAYVNVNKEPVLVDPHSRAIVYVFN